MKNLSQRNKIILAIIGVLVIVVIAMAVFFQAGGEDLFGSTVVHVSPENPTMAPGQIIGLAVNSLLNCEWSTSNANIVDFQLSTGNWSTGGIDAKSVKVHGVARGQSVITAHCVVGNRSTTVTVQ